jgi:hypothetical protein
MTGERRRYSRKGAIGRHSSKEEKQIMTTFIARHGDRTVDSSAAFQARKQRFTRSLASAGAVVLDAIEATRAMGSAHSTADRRAVLDRFAADTSREASRTAA